MSSRDYCDYVMNDLMADIDGLTSRPMFGGYGLYRGGTIFAIIIDDELFFKVDDSNRSDYELLGSTPFTYNNKNGKEYAMNYWRVPSEFLDNHDLLVDAIERSVAISRAKKTPKKKSR